MMAVARLGLHSTPYFGGGNRKAGSSRAAVADLGITRKLKTYEQGLGLIQNWDQSQANPVLLNLNIQGLLKQAKGFLTLQEKTHHKFSLPFVIGMAGGTASGKTTVKNAWMSQFNQLAQSMWGWNPAFGPVVDGTEMDHYYKDFSEPRKTKGDKAFFETTNLDEPDALTLDHAVQDTKQLKKGYAVRIPRLHYPDSKRHEGAQLRVPTPFYFVEGLFALLPKALRDLMDMSVFVAVDRPVQSQRWWQRAAGRGLSGEGAKILFDRGMAMHDQHVEPTRKHANIVIDGNAAMPQIETVLSQLAKLMMETFAPKKP